MDQVAIPVDVSPQEIERERSLGGAIALCAKAAGYEGKEVMDAFTRSGHKLDKAQWSRWASGGEGVVWEKLRLLMDVCGNDAPLFWMLAQRGYDLRSLRKTESETEKALRLANEEIAALRRTLKGSP